MSIKRYQEQNRSDVQRWTAEPWGSQGVMLRAAMWKNLSITTSLHPDSERTFPLAMQWIAEGRANLAPLITHCFPLRDIQVAYETFRDRVDGAQKVLVEFPSWKPPRSQASGSFQHR